MHMKPQMQLRMHNNEFEAVVCSSQETVHYRYSKLSSSFLCIRLVAKGGGLPKICILGEDFSEVLMMLSCSMDGDIVAVLKEAPSV